MKDLLKVKKGITHSGKFHTDDVLSTVLIHKFNKDIIIDRVSEYTETTENEEVIVFDIGLGEFDHHQQNRELNEFGDPYSAFGKLWRAYGKEFLKMYGFKKVDLAFSKFNRKYVSKVDLGDNKGYKNVYNFYENDLITRFNPTWLELKNNPNAENTQFFKAVDFAEDIFDNWIRSLYEMIELNDIEESIWNKAKDKNDGGVIVLEENIPWRIYANREKPQDIKFIISKSIRGGYHVCSIDSNEIEVVNSEYLKFVHPSGFMGVAENLDNAIMAAKYSMHNPMCA